MSYLWKRLNQWWRQLKLAGKGEDVFIGRNVHITRPYLANIGSHSAIDDGFYCTTRLNIDDYCHISRGVTVIGGRLTGLYLGGFNTIGPHSVIVAGSDMFQGNGLVSVIIPHQYRGKVKLLPVVMDRFSNICANVTVLPGVTLGEGSVVGACSLVLHDTDPWTVYAGIPAIPLKSRPKKRMLEAARKMGY